MRFLVYSDLQATDGDEVCHCDPSVPLQLYRVRRFLSDLARLYQEHQCDGLIDLGDTTDDRSAVPLPVIDALGQGFGAIPDGCHFKLTGNHEQYLRNAQINNRHLFQHKFKVVDGFFSTTIKGCQLTFVSYPGSFSRLIEQLKNHPVQTPAVLFGHFQVEGCQLGNGLALEGVPKTLLTPYTLCLLGHIHQPQSVTQSIHYVGSPFQQDWGESGQQKRVALLDLGKKIQLQWVPLNGYPEYRAINYEDFLKHAKADEEHRYRVMLTSHEQAENLFRHPLFRLAEPVYNYDTAQPESGTIQEDWSFEAICRRYLELIPPVNAGINLNADEMLALGLEIAQKHN